MKQYIEKTLKFVRFNERVLIVLLIFTFIEIVYSPNTLINTFLFILIVYALIVIEYYKSNIKYIGIYENIKK